MYYSGSYIMSYKQIVYIDSRPPWPCAIAAAGPDLRLFALAARRRRGGSFASGRFWVGRGVLGVSTPANCDHVGDCTDTDPRIGAISKSEVLTAHGLLKRPPCRPRRFECTTMEKSASWHCVPRSAPTEDVFTLHCPWGSKATRPP